METQMKDYYEAMENFAKNDRKESQICTSQSRLSKLIGGNVTEIWHNRINGKNISITYQIDGSYFITNLN